MAGATRRKIWSGVAGLLAILATHSIAAAQGNAWTCTDGGHFQDAGCWSDFSIPGPTDTVLFNLGGAYSVLSTQTQVVDTMSVGDAVTFELDQLFTVSNSLTIASDTSGESATFVLESGPMETSGLVLGSSLTTPGNLTLRAGATLSYSYLITYPDSIVTFGINTNVPASTSVMSQTGGGDPLYEGTLRIEAQAGMRPPAGTSYTLIDLGGFGVGEEFDIVVTSPPFGQRYVVDGNEFGASEITLTIEDQSVLPIAQVDAIDFPSQEPVAIVLGDMDGDGLDDIISILPGELTILANDGQGGLTGVHEYSIELDPIDVAVGDYDGDTTIDIVVLDQATSTMTFFYNPRNDPSDLEPAETFSTDPNPTAIVTVNLGEDSVPLVLSRAEDVVVVSKGPGKATGYRNSGSGNPPTVVAWVEIEDDSGPADSTDDEEREDDDTNVGIGHSSSDGFTGPGTSPSLTMIRTHDSGAITLVSNSPLQSNPVAITGARLADLDGIAEPQVVVATEAGVVAIFNQDGDHLADIPVGDQILGLAAGDADGFDSTYDDLVISTSVDETAQVELYTNMALGTAISLERTSTFEPSGLAGALVAGLLFDSFGIRTGIAGISPTLDSTPVEIFVALYERTPLRPCTAADFNGDGEINGADLGIIIAAWGPCGSSTCPADITGDGTVDGSDLGLFLNYWGPC